MTTSFVLIDMENVQPANLEMLVGQPYRVYLFLGESPAKIPRDIVIPMQHLGKESQYIEMSGNGPNALDFHIAYYLGKLAAAHPRSHYYIVSKDKGFDPLIRHLISARGGGLSVKRISGLSALPGIAPRSKPAVKASADKIDLVIANLSTRGQSRPRTEKTLKNYIRSQFPKDITDLDLDRLVEELQNRKFVQIVEKKVTYPLGRMQDGRKSKPERASQANEQLLLAE